MPTHDDSDLRVASIFLGSLVLLCVIGTLAYGLYSSSTPPAPISTEAPAPKGEAMARIYFEINSAELPAEAGGAIETIKERADAVPNLIVLISGYHDPSGDPEKNAELAKLRAEAAKAALIAAGVDAQRIVLRKPEVIPGTDDMQEARRVDLRLQ